MIYDSLYSLQLCAKAKTWIHKLTLHAQKPASGHIIEMMGTLGSFFFSGQMRGRRECIYRGNITAGLWVCVNTIACLSVSVWNWHFSHACSCSESLHGLTYFLFISLSSDLLLNKLWQPTYLLVISHDMETADLILFDFFLHFRCVSWKLCWKVSEY